jgi:hypothetical protein
VASAERLAELDNQDDDAAVVTVTDEVIDAYINRAPPSVLATVLAWAGGVLHARQAQRAVAVLGNGQPGDGSDVIRFESLIRLADSASPRLAEKVHIVTSKKRHQLAQIMLDMAVCIGTDPRAGLVEKVVAWRAAHRVRGDLQDRTQLAGLSARRSSVLTGAPGPTEHSAVSTSSARPRDYKWLTRALSAVMACRWSQGQARPE